jgi:protein TonB
MEIKNILQADVLDIIFDGKNKDYGAYQLRKSYNKRLATALMAMSGVILVFFVGSVLANAIGKKQEAKMKQDVVMNLEKVPDPPKEKLPPPPPPPPTPPPPPQVKMTAFTPPEILPDKQVDNPPPPNEVLETSKIGPITQAGDDDKGIVTPPVEPKGTGITVAPTVEHKDIDEIFASVQIEAKFPGGLDAWKRFLERAMSNYPERAVENGTQGVVKVQMVVDKEGMITDVKALNDPGDGLADYAVNIIKKGPHWIPAEQNGRKVSYRFVQSITFQLAQ